MAASETSAGKRGLPQEVQGKRTRAVMKVMPRSRKNGPDSHREGGSGDREKKRALRTETGKTLVKVEKRSAWGDERGR